MLSAAEFRPSLLQQDLVLCLSLSICELGIPFCGSIETDLERSLVFKRLRAAREVVWLFVSSYHSVFYL